MSFNVWLGGDVVDFGSVVGAIRAARADIVGLQEPEGNTRRIAEALGWYWSDRLHVVSRYPLIDPPAARGEYVLAQVAPGRVFALANVHLTSDPYGPYEVRSGRSLERVLANERATRLPEIRETLGRLAPLARSGIPTLMTGDSTRLAPGLDPGGRRRATRHPLSGALAGHRSGRACRLRGHLPGRAP